MPRKGYKSITVKERIYDYFFNEYSKVKKDYEIKKGIRSFSAYVTYRLSQLLELPVEKEHFVMINHGPSGVKIQDNIMSRVADVHFTPKGIYCPVCDASNCEHVRFALEQPDVKDIVKKKQKEGWKLPDV